MTTTVEWMYHRLDIIPNDEQRFQWQLDLLYAQRRQHPELDAEISEMIVQHLSYVDPNDLSRWEQEAWEDAERCTDLDAMYMLVRRARDYAAALETYSESWPEADVDLVFDEDIPF